jgi:hypothetical protein
MYYIKRPRSDGYIADDLYHSDSDALLPDISVCDHEDRFTGLFSADGNPIMRAPRPIGFGRDKEWTYG